MLGLGASGPQVVEGFHGVPYDKPMARIRDYINVCRMVWRREPVVYDGPTVTIPLPADQGSGLSKPLKLINHPVRSNIPIFWASLMGLSVTATAEHADGWLPIFFDPEKFHTVWGDELKAGLAKRDPSLGALQISAGGMVAIGDELVGDAATKVLDKGRNQLALYVGGMGARDKNFYNTICQKYGYVDEAIEIQDLYLSGQEGSGRCSGTSPDARQHQPGRPCWLCQRAHRRLPGSRRDPLVGQPGRCEPGRDDRQATNAARLKLRRLWVQWNGSTA